MSKEHLYRRKGSKYWQYTFTHKGKRYKGSTGLTGERQAHAWVQKKRENAINEYVGIKQFTLPPTFKEFSAQFLEYAEVHYAEKPATLTFYKSKLRSLLRFNPLRGSRLDHIDEALINRYKGSRMGVVANATCNRELATLGVLLRVAFERKLIQRIPRIAKFPEKSGRSYVLPRDKEKLLLDACSSNLRDLVILLIDTGLRAGEALRLKWSEVHFELGTEYVHVLEGKSRSAKRNIPMTRRVKAVLKRRQSSVCSAFVFPGRKENSPIQGTSVDHMFRKVCDQILSANGDQLFPKEFVLHSLRHTCLTRLGEAGASAFEIMSIAGHSSVVVSQRYVHPTPEALVKMFARMDTEVREEESASSLPHFLPQVLRKAA